MQQVPAIPDPLKLKKGTGSPQQIQDNRKPYFDALESADDIMAKGRIDLSVMENMMSSDGLSPRPLNSIVRCYAGRERVR